MEDKKSTWQILKKKLKMDSKGLKNNKVNVSDLSQKTISEVIGKEKNDSNNRSLKNKKLRIILAGFMIFSIIAMGFTGYKVREIRTKAFDLYIDDEKIASIRDKDIVEKAMKELEEELCKEYDADIVFDKEIIMEATHAKDNEITSMEELEADLKSKISFLVSAYIILIDEEEVGALKTKEEAENIIEEVKEYYLSYLDEDANITDIEILEDIEFKQKGIPIGEISKADELIEYIKTGSQETKTHTVEVGENFWTIAKFYDTTMEELEEANPDKSSDKLKPGDEVKLILPKSKLTVATTEEVEYIEDIKYEVKTESDKSMYKNQQKVKVKGKNGENRILTNKIKHNGVLVEEKILGEEIIQEPIDRVVVKGTKEVPKTVATGTFLMPARGRLSSGYGRRWGRMHRGIDIAAPTGTAIKASDGGTVVFSGPRGSYGNMVEISHGNGYTTRYAHCSKLYVKTGQKVHKGQHIANVGNTGRSTGSHVHFEVLKNGVNRNPSGYVR